MRLELPFGTGLDRYSGVMATTPGRMDDLRNFRPIAGKLQVRPGTRVVATLPAQGGEPCTSVELLQTMQSQREGIAVGYYAGSREVHVFRTSADGTDPVHIGRWFTLPATAAAPPHFTATETFGKAFIAHDEPHEAARAVTLVYDGIAGSLDDLRADFGEDVGLAFRGVETWRDFLVGWGFGDGTDPRPELVRISKPGRPDIFTGDRYFIIGDTGTAVTACRVAGSTLLPFKASSTYRITGNNFKTFGWQPLYRLYGALGPRLAISVEGIVYAWGFEGPYATTGASTRDLEPDLDLERIPPADLPAASLARDAFALYLPLERVIEWHWGKRIYVLDLDDEGARWSYRERPTRFASGALLFTLGFDLTGVNRTRPDGDPRIVDVRGRGPSLTLEWENQQHDGFEVLEVWLRHGDGDWTQDFPWANVTTARTQTRPLDDLEVGTSYTVAIRYRRGGQHSIASASDNPEDWPESSRHTFTVKPAVPTLHSLRWRRVSAQAEYVEGTFSPAPGQEDFAHEAIRHSDDSNPIPIPSGETTFRDQRIRGDEEERYVVAALAGATRSAVSNELSIYTGPPAPVIAAYTPVFGEVETADDLPEEQLTGWEVSWVNADPPGDRPIFDEYWTHVEIRGVHEEAVAPGLDKLFVPVPDGTFSETQAVRVRHYIRFLHHIFDYSPWRNALTSKQELVQP